MVKKKIYNHIPCSTIRILVSIGNRTGILLALDLHHPQLHAVFLPLPFPFHSPPPVTHRQGISVQGYILNTGYELFLSHAPEPRNIIIIQQ
jgi:hypothetical protein